VEIFRYAKECGMPPRILDAVRAYADAAGQAFNIKFRGAAELHIPTSANPAQPLRFKAILPHGIFLGVRKRVEDPRQDFKPAASVPETEILISELAIERETEAEFLWIVTLTLTLNLTLTLRLIQIVGMSVYS